LSYPLPLFPLGSVLFPAGMLSLRVFEARYLDLMSACLRSETPFGVVLIEKGSDVKQSGQASPLLATVGCKAELISCDVPQAGLMLVRAKGLARFTLDSVQQGPNGLQIGQVTDIAADDALPLPQEHANVGLALKQLIAALHLKQAGEVPFVAPYALDDVAWVSNRWCEVLPIPAPTKQKLMALEEPMARLELIASFLTKRGLA
jgi:uncharacterized protein